MVALANTKVATEEVLLELRDLGPNIAVLVVPLVDGGVLEVVGMVIVAAGLLHVVVNRDGVDPASVFRTLLVGGHLSLTESASEGSHVHGTGISCGVG